MQTGILTELLEGKDNEKKILNSDVKWPLLITRILYLFLLAVRPSAGYGLFIHEVFRSHITTHLNR